MYFKSLFCFVFLVVSVMGKGGNPRKLICKGTGDWMDIEIQHIDHIVSYIEKIIITKFPSKKGTKLKLNSVSKYDYKLDPIAQLKHLSISPKQRLFLVIHRLAKVVTKFPKRHRDCFKFGNGNSDLLSESIYSLRDTWKNTSGLKVLSNKPANDDLSHFQDMMRCWRKKQNKRVRKLIKKLLKHATTNERRILRQYKKSEPPRHLQCHDFLRAIQHVLVRAGQRRTQPAILESQ